jgi:hypothetical protein
VPLSIDQVIESATSLSSFRVCYGDLPVSKIAAESVRHREMAFFNCEVVPNLSGLLPYKVVFKRLGSVLGEWPVASIAEGEAQIAEALRSVGDVVPEDI